MKKKCYVFGLALILVLSSILSGCGKEKETSVSTSQESAGTPTYGGSIVVGITNDLDSLDPHKAVAAGTREVLFNIFEGLVKPDSNGNLVPAVASDYDISEDGIKYTFTLKDDVKFHNGETVTADDVIYSLKRCAGLLEENDPDVKQVSALSIISEVNKVDEKTIELILSEPNTELIGYLTCAIIPADYSEQDTKPIGTGPFRFVSYEALGSLCMEKNEDYYIEGVPYLDQVTFKICADTDSAFMELLAGSIDVFPYLTQAQASQLTDKFNIEVGNTNLVQALFLNNAVEPFNDIRVRQALCYGIDRQAIIDLVGGGNGTIIGSNMFPNFKKYFANDLANSYSYDTTKAKQLLKEAGYENGFEFTITVPSNYQFHVDTAQVIVEQLKQIGVTAKIQLIEWASWLTDVYRERNFESTIIGLDSELVPGDVLLRYNSDSSKNFLNYANAEFDEFYQKAIKTTKEEEKVEFYHRLQALLSEDAASVYIQDPSSLVAVNKELGGYTFYPVYVQDMSCVYYMAAQN